MKRTGLIVAVVLACTAETPAKAQQLAPSALAYTAIGWPWQGANDRYVVTPLMNSVFQVPGSAPTWSPDGARVAYLHAGDIMVMDATGANIQNITNSASGEMGVAWSPDGRKIAFASDRDGAPELYLMNSDGSAVARVTTQVGLVTGPTSVRPSWSPDNTRLAFTCAVEAGNHDICMIRSDGTGFVRLTSHPAQDNSPAWSPDGQSIAFGTSRYDPPGCEYCYGQLAIMSADGTSVSPLGIEGWDPTWSPDGSQIAFTGIGFEWTAVWVMDADGSHVRWLGDYAEEPAWMPASVIVPYLIVQCDHRSLACTFDASDSIGPIASYSWDFGDGITATGITASHTYADGGSTVVLTVTGENGLTATARQFTFLDMFPVVVSTVSCEALRCVFDWSGSYDPDGGGVTPNWDFGDGTHSCEAVPGAPYQCVHTYTASGHYTITATVENHSGGVKTTSQSLTVAAPPMHVGDLDATTTRQASRWTATVAVAMHDGDHRPVANAVVSASWNDGAAVSCTTDTTGRCLLSKSGIAQKVSVSLTVRNAIDGKHSYTPAGNHDPDGSSSGTAITVKKR